jgi:hypothetical protein
MLRLAYRIQSSFLYAVVIGLIGCHQPTPTGATSFVSAPPGGSATGGHNTGAPAAGGDQANAPTPAAGQSTPTRNVEETDLYRLEGTRLYYLNGYRGLMVFDVSDVDHPKLLGRSPIYGYPVDMVVHNGVATVVVGDWYGQMDDGTPFHGSIVRGIDASDPTNIKILGEAKLGGFVRDDRVVGNVIYAVSEDYSWFYGWDIGGAQVARQTTETVIVSSVSFAGGQIQAVGKQTFPGYSGVFNVTPNSILLAHDAPDATGSTELLYLDISDPNGAIVPRGALSVDGRVEGWGADNGRWNLDFADGKLAHVVGCATNSTWCDGNSGYVVSTVDFTNPDAPVAKKPLHIAAPGWSVAARFDGTRLYLSPSSYWLYGSGGDTTPLQVFDLSNVDAPVLAGTTSVPGTVWNLLPAPQQRLFALGSDWRGASSGEAVSLTYLDVSNPSQPSVINTSTFGQGWAWTPAAGTFKAFTMDPTRGLVVLPFSGWDDHTQTYNNGLQLIEFTPTSQRTAGAARTHGWVERGIFVGTRLVSLSDLALSVVDYSSHDAPTVTAELTLARNVVTAQPAGTTITEVSSDWWDNDVSTSEVRVLPIANAEETSDIAGTPAVAVDGVNAQVFRNGDFAYVVTNVRVPSSCDGRFGPPNPGALCYARQQQVQVVDLAGGQAVLRGKVTLPVDNWGWFGWGWFGCFWYDWFDGAEVVQYAPDGLAFRRWTVSWDASGRVVDGKGELFVVDLANADAPAIASTTITEGVDGWWGNLRVVGTTLYASHYEWFERNRNPNQWTVRYYADRIDLSDRHHPRVEAKINTPGLIVGGSAADPSLLYTIDYHWDAGQVRNDFNVVRVHGDVAEWLGRATLDGWVGSTFIVGDKAYLSAQHYDDANGAPYNGPSITLHAIDLADPRHPVDRVASDQRGWGWLLDVVGDRAVVQSGWGAGGVDIYQLSDGAAPRFRQFARTRGWDARSVARQDNALFLSSGYWGVQRIDLQ